jgi:hypothetical protein
MASGAENDKYTGKNIAQQRPQNARLRQVELPPDFLFRTPSRVMDVGQNQKDRTVRQIWPVMTSYPWCSRGTKGVPGNCYYASKEQCHRTISGIGGYCIRNPWYRQSSPDRARTR